MVGEEEEQPPPMYQRLPPMRMEGEDDEINYRPHPKMRTNQSFGARILELCNSLPRFGGREGEPVEKFIKTVDACMMNMHMTSHEAALALFSPASPLYDRAASFANFARLEDSYPNAQFWCAQDHTPRKAFVPYQPRRSSHSEITHSEPSEPSAPSEATGDSVEDIPSDPDNNTHRIPGAAKATDERTKRKHRKRRKARVSKRPKQKGRSRLWNNRPYLRSPRCSAISASGIISMWNFSRKPIGMRPSRNLRPPKYRISARQCVNIFGASKWPTKITRRHVGGPKTWKNEHQRLRMKIR